MMTDEYGQTQQVLSGFGILPGFTKLPVGSQNFPSTANKYLIRVWRCSPMRRGGACWRTRTGGTPAAFSWCIQAARFDHFLNRAEVKLRDADGHQGRGCVEHKFSRPLRNFDSHSYWVCRKIANKLVERNVGRTSEQIQQNVKNVRADYEEMRSSRGRFSPTREQLDFNVEACWKCKPQPLAFQQMLVENSLFLI